MSKVVDITGVSSKEARLKRIIASLEEIKDTLVDVIDAYEAEDESSDKLDLLTEAPASHYQQDINHPLRLIYNNTICLLRMTCSIPL